MMKRVEEGGWITIINDHICLCRCRFMLPLECRINLTRPVNQLAFDFPPLVLRCHTSCYYTHFSDRLPRMDLDEKAVEAFVVKFKASGWLRDSCTTSRS